VGVLYRGEDDAGRHDGKAIAIWDFNIELD
jgi:hypothetical protein